MPNQATPSDAMLVALDGSSDAFNAAEAAIQLANGLQWSIRAVYVVDEALVMDPYGDWQRELSDGAQVDSRYDLIERFEAQGLSATQLLEAHCVQAGVSVTSELVLGDVAELLRKQADQARLLAIGRRGRGKAGDSTALGQHFQVVAHHAQRPLLVGGSVTRRFQRLLLAYDGSERTRDALSWSVRLQSALQLEVVVLTIRDQDGMAATTDARLCDQLGGNGLTDFRFIGRSGDPAQSIGAVTDETEADLIVMGSYRHSPLLEWFTGSTVDQVLRTTRLPVLIST